MVMALPVMGLILAGTRPRPSACCAETTLIWWTMEPSGLWITVVVECGVGRPMAMRPGKITRNGNSILGTAAISGTLRAESMFFEAIAVWMTRKSVHQ